MSKHTLYGAEFSLYTGKVRAYLNYKNIPYEEKLSTLKVYKKIILPETGVKFIPVVKTPTGEFLQDTTNIIDQLEQSCPDKPIYPTNPKQRLVSLLLELFGDEWLVLAAMHYRWNHDNFPFIYQEFGRIISPNLPAFARGYIGKKIGSKFKAMVPSLGITDKSIPAIEKWYEQGFLADFNEHLKVYPYLLGSVPSIADFGFFGPLYAHLYRDPYPGKLMRKIASKVADWVERMKNASEVEGEFLADDQIPDTLIPILKELFKTHWPVLESTASKLSMWYKNLTEEELAEQPVLIPRRLGMHNFTINGVEEERLVLPYSLWMMQRPIAFYQGLDESDKNAVSDLINLIGAEGLLDKKQDLKITRHNNQFCCE